MRGNTVSLSSVAPPTSSILSSTNFPRRESTYANIVARRKARNVKTEVDSPQDIACGWTHKVQSKPAGIVCTVDSRLSSTAGKSAAVLLFVKSVADNGRDCRRNNAHETHPTAQSYLVCAVKIASESNGPFYFVSMCPGWR